MPGITAKSDTIYELVAEGSEVERVATGFTFTEGPIWHPHDQNLLFSDMPADIRRRYTPGEGVVEVRNPSNKCNGMTYDADLNLLVCEHVTSSVVREYPDGTRETVASHFEGQELNSPPATPPPTGQAPGWSGRDRSRSSPSRPRSPVAAPP